MDGFTLEVDFKEQSIDIGLTMSKMNTQVSRMFLKIVALSSFIQVKSTAPHLAFS